jgi:hypothetical protein
MANEIDLYANFISEQLRGGDSLVEDKEYSINYDSPTKKQEGALAAAHRHIQSKGYKVSHEGSSNSSHKEVKNPDVTYHYAHGDDDHHAFTVHKNGAAANDQALHKVAKNLQS